MNPPHVYIHIGRPKTGTTSIQKHLYANREALLSLGVLYPDIGIIDGAHHVIATSLLSNLPRMIESLPTEDEQVLQQQYLEQVKTHKPEKVVISSEFFTIMTGPREEEARQKLKAFFQQAPFQDSPITIISYFRNQPDHIESAFSQEVRNVALSRTINFDEFSHRFLSAKHSNYYWAVCQWAAVFGESSITVRPFERSQLAGGDAIADFLNVIGVSDSSGMLKANTEKNPSLSLQRIELMNAIAQFEIEDSDREKLSAAIQACPAVPSESVKQSMLGPEATQQIQRDYAESNAQLASRFLGREDGQLFDNKTGAAEAFHGAGDAFLHEFVSQLNTSSPWAAGMLADILQQSRPYEDLLDKLQPRLVKQSMFKKAALLLLRKSRNVMRRLMR